MRLQHLVGISYEPSTNQTLLCESFIQSFARRLRLIILHIKSPTAQTEAPPLTEL